MQEDSQLKILFIGGTGRLSKDVAEKALNDGNEVYLLTRGTNERKKFVSIRTVLAGLNTPISFFNPLKFMPVFPPTDASTMASSVVGILI